MFTYLREEFTLSLAAFKCEIQVTYKLVIFTTDFSLFFFYFTFEVLIRSWFILTSVEVWPIFQ